MALRRRLVASTNYGVWKCGNPQSGFPHSHTRINVELDYQQPLHRRHREHRALLGVATEAQRTQSASWVATEAQRTQSASWVATEAQRTQSASWVATEAQRTQSASWGCHRGTERHRAELLGVPQRQEKRALVPQRRREHGALLGLPLEFAGFRETLTRRLVAGFELLGTRPAAMTVATHSIIEGFLCSWPRRLSPAVGTCRSA